MLHAANGAEHIGGAQEISLEVKQKYVNECLFVERGISAQRRAKTPPRPCRWETGDSGSPSEPRPRGVRESLLVGEGCGAGGKPCGQGTLVPTAPSVSLSLDAPSAHPPPQPMSWLCQPQPWVTQTDSPTGESRGWGESARQLPS